MGFDKRRDLVLRFLASKDVIDIAQLSDHLGISIQTLKSQLTSIEKEAGYGVCFRETYPNRIEVVDRSRLALLLSARIGLHDLSVDKRLMMTLLLTRGYITLQNLADRLFMSRSSVEKHVAQISQQDTAIEATRHRGIRFAGGEEQRRSALVYALQPYLVGNDFLSCIRSFDRDQYPILRIFGERNAKKAQDFVRAVAADGSAIYTDESLAELFCNMLVTLWSVDCGAESLQGRFLGIAIEKNIQLRCECTVRRLSDELGLDLPRAELERITALMLSLRKSDLGDMDAILERMEPLIDRILSVIYRTYSINLSGDAVLRHGLALHIWTTAVRHISLASQPELYPAEELKRTYPLGFELATVAAQIMEEVYGYLPDESEIVYIALHLQAALERSDNDIHPEYKVWAIIVCHYGLAASNLISERLEHALPQLKVVGSYSLNNYTDHIDICDIVISTELLNETRKPIFYVTPMLHDPEIEPLRRFVHDRRYLNSIIETLLEEADVISISEKKTVEEVVNILSEPLTLRGDVADGFVDSVLERERIAPTDLDCIAIPHGDPNLVIDMHLVIGRASQGITWSDSTVNIIFLLAFSNQAFQCSPSPFSTFYRRLARPECEAKLFQTISLSDSAFKRQVISILLGG